MLFSLVFHGRKDHFGGGMENGLEWEKGKKGTRETRFEIQ